MQYSAVPMLLLFCLSLLAVSMASDEVISVGTEHFKIDIEIHYLAQTMDSDAPDLEAFEYNLCAIIQAGV